MKAEINQREPRKYEYIDSLRGIAILLVLLVHTWMENQILDPYLPRWVSGFMQSGRYGVQLFFIVSSFTLVTSHFSRIGERNATLNFFIRRYFRIAPMYYLAIIYFTFSLFIGFNPANMDLSNISVKALLTNAIFMHGLFPSCVNGYVPGGWSISAEFIFYFTLPFLCKYINSTTKALWLLIGSLLLINILRFFLVDSGYNIYDFLYFYFPNHLPAFSLGILSYWIIKTGIGEVGKKNINLLLLAGIAFLCVYIYTPPYWSYAIGFILLLLGLQKYPCKALSNKVLATIGKYSFSIYLVHFAILGVVKSWADGQPIIAADGTTTALINMSVHYSIIFIVSFVISYMTYKFIEIPGQNLGRRLIKKLDQQK